MNHFSTAGGRDAALGEISLPAILDLVEHAVPPLSAQDRITLYQDWIAAGGGPDDGRFAAWFNIGAIYGQHGDKASAIIAYRESLRLKPSFAAAAVNLGLALEASGGPAAALATWSAALQPDHDRIALLNHQGRLLEQIGRLDEAEALLRRSLRIDPAQPDVIQHWVHLRQKMCLWPVLDPLPDLPADAILAQCGPLGALALTDDVALQRAATESWVARKTVAAPERLAPLHGYRHQRIRIGYLSSDFCRHAMSYLIAELFERHDRTRFEVFGYCSTIDDGSEVRRRILASFDQLRLVSRLDDEQVARLIRADEVDILIDLNGLTAGSRFQVLRWKPAPVQATYLGFVGPVPLPELDALICDGFVVPPEQAAQYLPRPLAIDGVYQANESRRSVTPGLTRAGAGLPEDRFVLCCFCGHFKITEAVFAAWMSILQRAPDAVLWLADDNPWSRRAMQRAAGAAGVDPERLLFADRCAPELYMARLGLADLFLDTFPYNAGTVASDAIRMRLPIVTLPGRSFASRMAARLLDVYGVPDGIAADLDAYVDYAVAMATDPTLCRQVRSRFTDARWNATLGDSTAFARVYEDGLLSLLRRPAEAG